MATINNARNWAINCLSKTSSSPDLDAEVLLCHVLKIERGWLYANPDYQLSNLAISKYRKIIAKRRRHWPVAYLIGHKEFFSLDFKVSPDVLIPRPETELLVERALEILKARSYKLKAVVDLGTGSGNIITSLAVILSEAKNLNFFALDSSSKALQIARLNAHRHGALHNIKFLHGHLLDPLSHLPLMRGRMSGGRSILILANLPYLTPDEYSSNPDLRYEPRSALLAGPDGLKYFRNLFKQLQKKSPPARGGVPRAKSRGEGVGEERSSLILLFEHAPSQKPALKNLAKKYFPFAQPTFHKDLAGKYRVVEIQTSFLPHAKGEIERG